jgi:hypothetical protein
MSIQTFFSKEVLGMPPDRDIEFVIELLPGMTPICKSPYRMSTLQLMELKDHTRELEGKGYIHPSSSSWGASVIFVPKKMAPIGYALNIKPSTK